MQSQGNWRWCHKCEGLFYDEHVMRGSCPAGGEHENQRSGYYTLLHNNPQPNGQRDWRWCHKCEGLFFGRDRPSNGICPAGGHHENQGSGDYTLYHDRRNVTLITGGQVWRWCHKCEGLFFDRDRKSNGVCPAGDQHENQRGNQLSGYYTLHHDRPNFTFDRDITAAQRNRLVNRHWFAYSRIARCGNLAEVERLMLYNAYHRQIRHSTTTNDVNGQATVGGSRIWINFGNLFPLGDNEITQTLIHEMMHCAGFTHSDRQAADVPGDGGAYYGSPPLRAEICIAGTQSDLQCFNVNGRCSIQ